MEELELDVGAAQDLLRALIGESESQLAGEQEMLTASSGSLGEGFCDYESRLLQLYQQLHMRTFLNLQQVREYGVQALAQVEEIAAADDATAQALRGES